MANANDFLKAFAAGAATATAKPAVVAPLPPVAVTKATKVNTNISFLAMAVAGGAGYLLWKKHPVLGALSGIQGGFRLANLAQGSPVVDEVRHLVATAAGVGSSLAWQKHPALGFVGGVVAVELSALVAGFSSSKK